MKSISTSLLLSIAIFSGLATYFWFVCDDAFISFRYSDNLANGYGLLYNHSEKPPIEGYSNFLWVILGTVIIWLGFDISQIIPCFSILSGIIGLIVLEKTLKFFQIPKKIQAFSLLSTAIFPPYFIYGTSGLETLPAAVSLFGCFVYLLIEKKLLTACFFAICLALLRPEGILWVLVISVLSIFNCNFKLTFKFLGIVFSIFTIYFCWRWNYFEELLPVTVVNKVGLTSFTFLRGLDYLAIYLFTYLLPFLLLTLLLFTFKNSLKNRLKSTIILLTGGLFIYPLTSGGDFMTSGRFFVTTVLFQSLIIALTLNQIKIIQLKYILTISFCLISIASCLSAFNLGLVPKSILSKFHFRLNTPEYRTEAQQHAYMKYNSERWHILGKTLHQHTEPGDSIVAGAIGNLGFYSKRHIYDRFGLVEKRVANLSNQERQIKSPGHDKAVKADFFLDKNPTILKAYIMPTSNQERIKNQLKRWQNQYENKYQGEEHPLEYIDSKNRQLTVLILRLINDKNFINEKTES